MWSVPVIKLTAQREPRGADRRIIGSFVLPVVRSFVIVCNSESRPSIRYRDGDRRRYVLFDACDQCIHVAVICSCQSV